ncbi:hypothetical protein L21SP5_01877 [Salinivirga cyanobacteriivorans]|uniref:Uncharacterized protein n=1 Tax=Salinivirga cyanobacteriivorans TaxID=1307839 RepID=A0A0S2HZS7_9BACT|nr:hypothetical protein L21SP5_01877 [Salinivirga cyanobacteriivorans]
MFKRLLSIILVFTAIFIIANKAIYLHVHEANDGTLIVHAHPFNKSADNDPIKKHHHNLLEYVLLSHFDLLFIASLLFTLAGKFAPEIILGIKRKKCSGHIFLTFKPLRAPPLK